MNETNQKIQQKMSLRQQQQDRFTDTSKMIKNQKNDNKLTQQYNSKPNNNQQAQVTQEPKEQLKEQAKTNIKQPQQKISEQNKSKNLDQLSQKEENIRNQLQFILQAEKKREYYIKEVESKREQTFKQMQDFILQSRKLILSHQKQIKQTIETTKWSTKQIQLQKQINCLKTNKIILQNKLSKAQEEIKMKNQLLIKQQENLQRLEFIYLQKDQQKQNEVIKLENNFQYFKNSYLQQAKSQKANYELKLKQERQNVKNEYKNILDKRFLSQQKLLQQKQDLQNQLQQKLQLFQSFKQENSRKIQTTNTLLSQFKLKIQRLQTQNKSMQNQIKQLITEKNNKFIQLSNMKTLYEQKSKELFQTYKQQIQKDRTKHQAQINIMLSNKDSEIKEIKNTAKCILKSKQNELLWLKQQKVGLIMQNKTIDQQLKNKKQQINHIQDIVQQITNLLSNHRGQSIHDIKQLTKQVQALINLAKRCQDQKRQSEYLANHLSSICKLNHEYLKKIRNKLASAPINILQKIPQDKNNPNHYGSLLNQIFDKIKQDIQDQHKSWQSKSSQLSQLKNHNFQLENQLKVRNIAYDKTTQKNKQLEIQIYNLRQELQISKIQTASLKKQRNQQLQARVALQLKIKSLQIELDQQKTLHQESIIKIQTEYKENQEKEKQLQERIKLAGDQLQIANNEVLLKQELVQSLNSKIKQLQQKIKTSQLKNNLLQAQKEKLKSQMSQKQRLLRKQHDQILEKISRTSEEVFEKKLQNKSIDGVISFIRQHGSCSSLNTSFTVSEILEKMPKQRTFLIEECCKFFGTKYISTKLSFKYDQYFKNFSEYIPIPPKKFLFAIIMKTKKDVVFGVISDSVGKESKALAFNLKTKKIMRKSQRTKNPSTAYDCSMLKFGNDEIIIRNNFSLSIRVNTMILGERYFEFTKEDLVGKETSETVELESLEIHKITAI